MIIDSFPFHNELDILRIRLEELKDVVDYHVLVECDMTQSRIEKPFYYQENKHLFEDFSDKIIDLQVNEHVVGGEAHWGQEMFARTSILNGLDELQERKNFAIQNNDYLIVSDLDEIPSGDTVKKAVSDKPIDPVSFNHYFISYFYNLYCRHRGWWGSVLTDFSNLKNGWNPQSLRHNKDEMLHIGEWNTEFHGWHFSSCTDFDGLWSKWLNNIEPHNKAFLFEPNAKEDYRKLFDEIVVGQKRFFYCDDVLKDDIALEVMPNHKLPKYMQKNLSKYEHLLLPYEMEELEDETN